MLNTPRFLIAAALLLWGWQTGLLVFAAIMGVVVEASHWVRWRIDFSIGDMCRIWDMCCLLTVGAGVYCVMTNDSVNDVMVFFQTLNLNASSMTALQLAGSAKVFFQWWPLLLYLCLLAQAYGVTDRLPATVYSILHRRRLRRENREPEPGSGANFGFLYVGVCLYSASLSLRNAAVFYWLFAGVCLWGLYAVRPRRFSQFTWTLVAIFMLAAGYVGQREYPGAAAALEGKFIGMFWQWLRSQRDANGFDTAIGDVGDMKGSGGIVMRLESRVPPPSLLPESVFCRFDGERWDNPMWMSYEDVPALQDGETWVLSDAPEADRSLLIARYFGTRMMGVAQPRTTSVFDQMPVGKFMTNQVGNVRAGRGVPFIVYRTVYGGTNLTEHKPMPILEGVGIGPDLAVPEFEDDALALVATEIGAHWRLSTDEIVNRVGRYFSENFTYSLANEPDRRRIGERGRTLIGRFLLDARRGHCEYFATATALLLRYMGVPCRYVLGWVVHEKGDGEHEYIVRTRHAHAWVRYWSEDEQQWRVLDTTPASGIETDQASSSWMEPLKDWWAGRLHAFRMWRYYGGDSQWQLYVLGVLLVLLIVSGWRIFTRRRRHLADPSVAAGFEFVRLGADSDFYEIDRRITASGLSREKGETLIEWLRRLEERTDLQPALLREMLLIHYRYRFDPMGIQIEDRKRLQDVAREWLARVKIKAAG